MAGNLRKKEQYKGAENTWEQRGHSLPPLRATLGGICPRAAAHSTWERHACAAVCTCVLRVASLCFIGSFDLLIGFRH